MLNRSARSLLATLTFCMLILGALPASACGYYGRYEMVGFDSAYAQYFDVYAVPDGEFVDVTVVVSPLIERMHLTQLTASNTGMCAGQAEGVTLSFRVAATELSNVQVTALYEAVQGIKAPRMRTQYYVLDIASLIVVEQV